VKDTTDYTTCQANILLAEKRAAVKYGSPFPVLNEFSGFPGFIWKRFLCVFLTL
jgi:hypothetical protein